MNRFKYSLYAAAGILVLASVITAVSPQRVMAALGFTPVRDVDQPARQPRQDGFGFAIANGITTQVSLSAVPAGKRLVIESFSADASVPSGQTGFFFITTTAGGVSAIHTVPVVQAFADAAFPGSDALVTAQSIRIYADPGTTPSVSFRRSSSAGGAFCSAFISGYFVDL